MVVGFSLGGNIVCKFLGENRMNQERVLCCVSVCQGYSALRAQETFLQWDQFRRFYNFLMADNMKKIILSHKPGQSGSDRVNPGQTGSERVRPGQSGSTRVNPGQSGSTRVNPGQSGSERVRAGQHVPSESMWAEPPSSGPPEVRGSGSASSGRAFDVFVFDLLFRCFFFWSVFCSVLYFACCVTSLRRRVYQRVY
ncbi:Monoacylglycerol lipase ABHD2-A [Liparis tanakae]|uniref:Monoacylglycerol lipase ABHD2-A n=1 Tax=Liparis tanakae TaxID=230148 RepID=A0A4Z2EFZ8_9TELE|nr:Monoacylglycerol lipase ABHD2-A [Liparis tanakae]